MHALEHRETSFLVKEWGFFISGSPFCTPDTAPRRSNCCYDANLKLF